MTRMTRPDCAVMCNLINTHTHTHTHEHESRDRGESGSGSGNGGDSYNEVGGERALKPSGNRGASEDARGSVTPTSNQELQLKHTTPPRDHRIIRRTKA